MVESVLVLNKGDRITREIIFEQINVEEYYSNTDLPAKINMDSDKAERELILRQLLYLRQDVSELKQMLVAPKDLEDLYKNDVKSSTYFLPKESKIKQAKESPGSIDDAKAFALQDESVGEISMQDIEHEIIERTLLKMNGNRRKAAKALNISERTLYRKIKEYGIEK